MKALSLCLHIVLLFALNSFAQPHAMPPQMKASLVDYSGFEDLVQKVNKHRANRTINVQQFNEMASEPNTIILDTRPKAAFDRKHIKGAVHLNFSDFTAAKLAKVIPSKDTRILIYCNNNFIGDLDNFPTKMFSLALNIPTYINLVGYGYENIYELSNLLVLDKRHSHLELIFEGTAVRPEVIVDKPE